MKNQEPTTTDNEPPKRRRRLPAWWKLLLGVVGIVALFVGGVLAKEKLEKKLDELSQEDSEMPME